MRDLTDREVAVGDRVIVAIPWLRAAVLRIGRVEDIYEEDARLLIDWEKTPNGRPNPEKATTVIGYANRFMIL